jgi:hypothetical protein
MAADLDAHRLAHELLARAYRAADLATKEPK